MELKVNFVDFYDKQITNIPIDKPGYCTIDGKDYVPEKDNCDTFYNIYCKNIAKEFTAGNNGVFDTTKFRSYKPECACFIDPPDWFKQSIVTPIPKCFYPGCEKTANVIPSTLEISSLEIQLKLA
jgi:hypothetical protein